MKSQTYWIQWMPHLSCLGVGETPQHILLSNLAALWPNTPSAWNACFLRSSVAQCCTLACMSCSCRLVTSRSVTLARVSTRMRRLFGQQQAVRMALLQPWCLCTEPLLNIHLSWQLWLKELHACKSASMLSIANSIALDTVLKAACLFLWSAPVAFRRVALETSEWTSRDSNHHRQSVSAGKTNAIPTEPSGRLVLKAACTARVPCSSQWWWCLEKKLLIWVRPECRS